MEYSDSDSEVDYEHWSHLVGINNPDRLYP